MQTAPLFVHCCHCTWCQRESGTAFAFNALIETDRLTLLEGAPELVPTPTVSGAPQKIYRCPDCSVALWSHYGMATGDKVSFVRVGTLDDALALTPDIHIFTSTKQPWLSLSGDVPVVEEYYDRMDYWPPESIARFAALKK